MKRSIMKMMRTIFLILTMAVMLPAAASADLAGSGSGKETDPHVLTVGAGTNQTFVYTLASYESYAWYSYLDVKFPAMAEVSFRNQGDKVMVFKRDGISTYKQLSHVNSLIVKKGETIHLCIKGNSAGTNTLTINCRLVTNASEYCSENAYGTHTYTAGHDSKCHNCGYQCTHPKASRTYRNEYTAYNGKHKQIFSCAVCQETSLTDKADEKNCTFKKWKKDTNYDRHYGDCTVCGYTKTENCTLKTSYTKNAWNTHVVAKTCTKCKQNSYGSTKTKSHTFKNNVCTKCKFKRIVPGTVKVTSAKQSGKMKKTNTHYPGQWSYNEVLKTWIYHKPHDEPHYNYTINVKLNKAKNAKQYVISTTASIDGSIAKSTKTSIKCTYTASSKKSKVTIYVIPVSKTGTPGKAVKKVVSVSN